MPNPYASPEQQNDVQPSLIFAQNVRGMQIITATLAFGSLVIWGVMLVLSGAVMDGEPDVLAWIGIGMAAVMFVAHLVIPQIITNSQTSSLSHSSLADATADEQQTAVLAPIRTGHIIGCAMLEGAAVFNAIAYMVEHYIGNVIAGAMLIALIAVKIPTTTGLNFKVQDKLREIERT